MIPDLQAALVCEDVRLEVNGANTLVGVINVLAAPVIPFRILKLCVYTRWTSGQGRFTQRVRILAPDDEQELAASDTPFDLPSPELHTTNVALFGGLEFPQAGDYPIEILLDGELKLRFGLRVLALPSPPS